MKLILKVFEEYGATVNPDDPVVLRLAIIDTEGLEEYQRNRGIDEEIEELGDRLEKGEISEEDYNREKASLEEGKTSPEYPVLGSGEAPWSRQVEFTPDWLQPNLISRVPDRDVFTLTPDLTAYAVFGYNPEEAEPLPEGAHRVKATLGGEESNEVGIAVTKDEEKPSPEELARKAGYLLTVGALVKGTELIDTLLEQEPMNIEGLILKGDYHAAMGEREVALNAYQRALEAYNATGPREDDPPRVIIAKMNRVSVTPVDQEQKE